MNREKRNGLTAARNAEIVRKRLAGASHVVLADEYGLHEKTISRICVTSGVKQFTPKRRPMPPVEYVNAALSFDPDTGEVRWRSDRPDSHFASPVDARRWRGRFAGRPAGRIETNGYRYIALAGTRYRAHRLALWVYSGGVLEPEVVDHTQDSLGPDDLRAEVLRAANASLNAQNRVGTGRVGRKWVCRTPNGKYAAKVQMKNGTVFRQTFDTAEAAHAAASKRAKLIHGAFHQPRWGVQQRPQQLRKAA